MRGEYPGRRTGCTACRRSPTCRTRLRHSKAGTARSPCRPDSRRRRCRCSRSRSPAITCSCTDAVYGPTRRFCELHLKRFGIDVELLRPARRRGHRDAVPAEHAHRVRRIAGLADVRGPRCAGDRAAPRTRTACSSSSTTRGRRRSASARSIMASTSRCTPRRSTSAATATCCSASIVCSEAMHRPLHRIWTDMGVAASPDDCFLGLRGLRTLPTRLARHRRVRCASPNGCAAGPRFAKCCIRRCPGARGHALWKRDFRGASGLFGVVLQPVASERIAAMLDGMRLFRMGWSWGGFESLIIPTWPERWRSATRVGHRAGRACGCTSASSRRTI